MQVDTALITILQFEKTVHYQMFRNCEPTELTNADLTDIEKILKQCIDNYNPGQEKRYDQIKSNNPRMDIDKKDFVIDLTRYNRQYIAVSNGMGEKEVWVNCFYGNRNEKSKTDLVIVEDGGNCYFKLKINLTTGIYYELMVNGDS